VLSRFTRKVGEDNLNKIIDEKVVKLLKTKQSKVVDVVLDASFIKAWSTRDPTDNQRDTPMLTQELEEQAELSVRL